MNSLNILLFKIEAENITICLLYTILYQVPSLSDTVPFTHNIIP